jgi:sigma-E factor negative regulatory protein RseB
VRLALARTALVGTALPLLLLLGLVGASATVVPGDGTADDDPQALEALGRAVRASGELAYHGTQVISTWGAEGGTTQLLEVWQSTGGQRWERAQVAGRSTAVTSLHAGQDAAVLAPQYTQILGLLASSYRLAFAGQARVAGREAEVVVASNQGRERARVWLDTATGLPLRQEVLDASGRLRRMATFIDIDLDPASDPPSDPASRSATTERPATTQRSALPHPTPAVLAPPAWPRVVSAAELDRMRDDGWTCPARLTGGLQLVDARFGAQAGSAPALHLTYTDGLSAVSVFLQRGRLDAGGLPGFAAEHWVDRTVYLAQDWPMRVVWQDGPEVVTLVGDTTADEARSLVAQLSAGQPGDPGPMARIALELRGMFAWLHRDSSR